jgi:hypothetical protein
MNEDDEQRWSYEKKGDKDSRKGKQRNNSKMVNDREKKGRQRSSRTRWVQEEMEDSGHTLCLPGATGYGPSSGDIYHCIPRARSLQFEFIQVRVAVYDMRKHLQSLGNEYLEKYR